jgi:hypothetical protein
MNREVKITETITAVQQGSVWTLFKNGREGCHDFRTLAEARAYVKGRGW